MPVTAWAHGVAAPGSGFGTTERRAVLLAQRLACRIRLRVRKSSFSALRSYLRCAQSLRRRAHDRPHCEGSSKTFAAPHALAILKLGGAMRDGGDGHSGAIGAEEG
jgi:hypothetical protein